jgi:predicted nucleic acid-binding protein
MMLGAYADTSFFVSLYLRDVNLPLARALLMTHRGALPFTSLQRFEVFNAIRVSVHRGNATALRAANAISEIEKDLKDGNLFEAGLIWPEVLEVAEEIGAAHSATLGIRSLDLLHISAAVSFGADLFLTFDRRQRAGAEAAGLKLGS